MLTPFTWIQTRDGSPTLWHNELGESFRSVKGAFTESWAAFNEPALRHAQSRGNSSTRVGEFGLGAGTNWLLWTLATHALGLSSSYTAIERDLSAFRMGRARWREMPETLATFLNDRLPTLGRTDPISTDEVARILSDAREPVVYPSLEAAREAGAQFDIWFHDPFGFDVNPDGYTHETLALCQQLWTPGLWGGSYACNRRFRDALAALAGVEPRVVDTGGNLLKRERMEFSQR